MKKAKIKNLELWKELKKAETDEDKKVITSKLVEIYYPIVKKISYSVAKKVEWKVTPEELSSYGVDGLYAAIEKFSIVRGVDFVSYASMRIRGSMIDGIRKDDMIPRSVRSNHNKIEKIRRNMECEKGRKVTDEEVLKKAGINSREFRVNLKKYNPVTFSSIEGSDICDINKHDDFQQDSNDTLIDHKTSSPDSRIIRKEFLSKVLSKDFSSIEQKIIYMYYYRELTMDAISEKLNMSESRISQIHKDILLRLKNKINRNPSYFDKTISNCIYNCNNVDPLF